MGVLLVGAVITGGLLCGYKYFCKTKRSGKKRRANHRKHKPRSKHRKHKSKHHKGSKDVSHSHAQFDRVSSTERGQIADGDFQTGAPANTNIFGERTLRLRGFGGWKDLLGNQICYYTARSNSDEFKELEKECVNNDRARIVRILSCGNGLDSRYKVEFIH